MVLVPPRQSRLAKTQTNSGHMSQYYQPLVLVHAPNVRKLSEPMVFATV
jgi:hypothetical protein